MHGRFSYENISGNLQIAKFYKRANMFLKPRESYMHSWTSHLAFKNTYVIGTGLSDFYKMIIAVLKKHFPKMKPQVVSYRKYKEFYYQTFLDL